MKVSKSLAVVLLATFYGMLAVVGITAFYYVGYSWLIWAAWAVAVLVLLWLSLADVDRWIKQEEPDETP